MAIDNSKLDSSKEGLARAQVILSKIGTVKLAGVVDVDGNPDLAIPLGVQVDVISLWEDRAQALIDGAVAAVPQIGPVKDPKGIAQDVPPGNGV